MGLAARVAGVTVAFALIAGGGYVVGDIYDVVPGVMTRAPLPAPAAPFPVAPGAIAGDNPQINLSALKADAPIPTVKGVGELTKNFLAEKKDIGRGVSLLVTDLATGEIVAAHKPDVFRVPASTVKLLVGTAAIAELGTAATLDTRVVEGAPGEIVLVGGGDMLLSAGKGDPSAINGHAGLEDLAAQVAASLTTSGQSTADALRLRVDETLFTGPKLSPAWDPANVRLGYIAPITPLGVDAAIPAGAGTHDTRYSEPSLNAAGHFAAALAKAGVTIDGSPTFGAADPEATELGRISSAPLGEIVDYVLQTSDNTIAEVLGRLVAINAGLPGSFDGARAAVLGTVERLGVNVNGAKIADASGLGDGSELTARLLVALVSRLADPTRPDLRPAAVGLPIAGLSGTLYQRYLSSDARGLVRAKTGSLPGVVALSGTALTLDGRLLGFAVLLDKVPEGNSWNARAYVDAYISALVKCGC